MPSLDINVDAQLQVEDGGTDRALRITDLTAVATGDATEDTLLALLALIQARLSAPGTVFHQAVASAEWTVPVDLAYQPNIAIYDSFGNEIEVDIHYEPATFTVTLSAPTTGTAVLS